MAVVHNGRCTATDGPIQLARLEVKAAKLGKQNPGAKRSWSACVVKEPPEANTHLAYLLDKVRRDAIVSNNLVKGDG